MCIIAVCNERKLSKAEFDKCIKGNAHGMGWAQWDGKNVSFEKGFINERQAWESYQTLSLPHVVHFRLASVGEICPDLTHPFVISNRSGLTLKYHGKSPVLFHNGTVGEWQTLLTTAILQTKIVPSGIMSDSRAMAIALSVVGDTDFLNLYSSSRWAVVSKDGVKLYGRWIDSGDGIMFSNDGFRPVASVIKSAYQNANYWITSPVPSIPVEDGDDDDDGEWKERHGAVKIYQGAKIKRILDEKSNKEVDVVEENFLERLGNLGRVQKANVTKAEMKTGKDGKKFFYRAKVKFGA